MFLMGPFQCEQEWLKSNKAKSTGKMKWRGKTNASIIFLSMNPASLLWPNNLFASRWKEILASSSNKFWSYIFRLQRLAAKPKWSLGAKNWLIAARAYPGFCSMKRLGVFLLPLEGMLVHRRSLPHNLLGFPNNSPVPIYTPRWREALWELSVFP